LTAYDADAIEDKAKELIAKIPIEDRTPQDIIDCRKRLRGACTQASATFNGELNNYIDNVRKQHEQIIDSVNIDAITEWDTNLQMFTVQS
jgi:type I restriction enzyme R subunit